MPKLPLLAPPVPSTVMSPWAVVIDAFRQTRTPMF